MYSSSYDKINMCEYNDNMVYWYVVGFERYEATFCI